MSDLAKLVSEIRGLTKAEADQLIGLLGSHWNVEDGSAHDPRSDATDDMKALNEEDGLVAEAINLKAEAVALSRSLDETFEYVRSRCEAILEAK